MQVTIVYVQVKPDHVRDFIEATRLNHEASVKEPGNLRFDVLQLAEDPTHFVLYEAYVNEDDAAAHKATQHYLMWRNTVANWMANPREGVPYSGLFPT
jgi:autoinducer 2-degrading protein